MADDEAFKQELAARRAMFDAAMNRLQRFVEEFCIDFNATQAAIRAGYAADTARVTASRLRANPAVAAAIAQAVAALKARSEASSDRWLLEVLDIAYGDPDAKTEDGKPATRLTFGEKVRALELQGRALGFVKQELDVKAQTAIPIQILHQQIP
jgi:Terminase small subunit